MDLNTTLIKLTAMYYEAEKAGLTEVASVLSVAEDVVLGEIKYREYNGVKENGRS